MNFINGKQLTIFSDWTDENCFSEISLKSRFFAVNQLAWLISTIPSTITTSKEKSFLSL